MPLVSLPPAVPSIVAPVGAKQMERVFDLAAPSRGRRRVSVEEMRECGDGVELGVHSGEGMWGWDSRHDGRASSGLAVLGHVVVVGNGRIAEGVLCSGVGDRRWSLVTDPNLAMALPG